MAEVGLRGKEEFECNGGGWGRVFKESGWFVGWTKGGTKISGPMP